jgi:GAF domain-containing protein
VVALKVAGDFFDAIREAAGRADEAERIAELIRSVRGYRWVGLYKVTSMEVVGVAWTGAEAPAHPRFPLTQGLCGAAVRSSAPVVVGDVRTDSRYLTTFGSTRSEIVVPVVNGAGEVLGLIDVESERVNAFGDADKEFLQHCAGALLPLFRERA